MREGVQYFLAHSRNQPLSLSLKCANPRDSDQFELNEAQVTQTLQILVPHHRRWEHLKLRILPASMAAIQLKGEDVPMLRTVQITCPAIRSEVVIRVPFLEDAPRLHHLHICADDDKIKHYPYPRLLRACASLRT
jgi:hypothetical protein